MADIIANRIRTPDGTVLQSFNRHDYKTYTDKNGEIYMVDGGCDYLRRSAGHNQYYEDLTVYSDDPHSMVRDAMHWGTRGPDGKSPLNYIKLCDMTNDHIVSCLRTQHQMAPQFRKAMEDELNFRNIQGE